MATNNSINLSAAGLARYDGAGTFTGVTVTQHDLLIGAASNGITSVAPSATVGIPVVSAGASADPAFGTAVVAGGGTGAVTLTGVLTGNGTSAFTASAVTQHDVLLGGASNAIVSLSPSTAGFVLTSNGVSADPSFQAASASGFAPYVNVTGTTQTMAVNTGYVSNNAGLVTFTPPATCAVGTVFAVAGAGAGGWTINLVTNSQTINDGSSPATTALASTNQFDSVQFVCITANSVFSVLNSQGNLAVS